MVRALEQDAGVVETGGRLMALVSRDAGLAGWVPAGWRGVSLAGEAGAAAMEQRLGIADVVVVDARRAVCVELVRLLAARRVPVVVLAEQHALEARERAYLDAGADAVIGAGWPAPLVAARVDAVVRAAGRGAARDVDWAAGDLAISLERHEVRRAGAAVRVTRTEFDVLALLARRDGAVVPARTLGIQVWGSDSESALHSVRVYVHRLREKLEATPQAPTRLVTEGDGYRLVGARSLSPSTDAPLRVAVVGADGRHEARQLRNQLERADVWCTHEPSTLERGEIDAIVALGAGDALRFVRRAPIMETVPVVAVLPVWNEYEAARALERGADDCIALEAGTWALRSRLDAAVRRARRGPANGCVVRTGALAIDRARRRVHLEGDEVELTRREFEVLDLLAESAGRVVSHEELLARVWGEGSRSEVHLVRMYIAYLRAKLEREPGRPRYLVNEWGRGYRLALLPVRD